MVKITERNKYIGEDKDILKNILLASLPKEIFGGYTKQSANISSKPTIAAMKAYPFTKFNTQERISLLIFDIDYHKDQEAKEYFKTMDEFSTYLWELDIPDPTYITQTSRGYHFAYHLANPVFTNNKKQMNFLYDIKRAIIQIVGCDPNASFRNFAIWRNPLLHPFFFNYQYNYQLNDFAHITKKARETKILYNKKKRLPIYFKYPKKDELQVGQRNKTIFYAGMRWAYKKKDIAYEDILNIVEQCNNIADEPLSQKEIESISNSVYKYWRNDTIVLTSYTIAMPHKNAGAMKFEPISSLSYDKYLIEIKRRQSLSAERTNQLVSKETKLKNIKRAQELSAYKRKSLSMEKIEEAKNQLKFTNKKITIAAISRISKLHRNTVSKYLA